MFTVNVKIWIHLRCDFDSHLNTNIKLSYGKMSTGWRSFFSKLGLQMSEVYLSGYILGL